MVCVLRAVPGNASTRQLLVTQQYHNPDLSTQAKVLFGIKVIFPSLPPWLIKAPASNACLILSSSRKRICCPVKHASFPKCCTQTDTKGKPDPQRLQRQESSPRGGKQHSWEEGGRLCHRSTAPVRWKPMLCLLQSEICCTASSNSLHLPWSARAPENQRCRRPGSSPPTELFAGRCSEPAESQSKEPPKHFLGRARTPRLHQLYCTSAS